MSVPHILPGCETGPTDLGGLPPRILTTQDQVVKSSLINTPLISRSASKVLGSKAVFNEF